MFCEKTWSSWPHGIRTRYWVLTPTKLTSLTTPPGMVLPGASSASPTSPISTFSGRIPIQPRSPGACERPVGDRDRDPVHVDGDDVGGAALIVPSIRLDWPRKFATNVERGFS